MKRNKHSLSHYKLLTCDQGELVPIGLMEVLPGDTIQQATSALVRMSPMLAPMMHPVRVRIHHWFVPNRIIWDDFEKFITGGPDGNDASVLPYRTISSPLSEGGLGDYLGLPTGVALGAVNMLPYRAYALVYNEYYRDQDLQTPLAISKASGADSTTSTTLQNVCWEKDYFTTARPWTEKGTVANLAIGSSGTGIPKFNTTSNPEAGGYALEAINNGGGHVGMTLNTIPAGGNEALTWNNPALELDIQALRESLALQRFAENRAKFGSRYTEYLRSLGVRPRDSRLDRPEYLGGGRQTIQVSEVLQTGTDYNANTGVGQMKGHGIGAMRSNRYRRFFEEHGYVITLMSVLPKTIYAQGLEKHWKRTVNEEFYQKELENIGQAEVYNREIYAPHATPAGIFGYQDRYDEYRRMESKIAGEFKSTLSHWHMARIFASDPALNATFVAANPTKRMLASTSTDGLYIMVNHSIQARRIVGNRG